MNTEQKPIPCLTIALNIIVGFIGLVYLFLGVIYLTAIIGGTASIPVREIVDVLVFFSVGFILLFLGWTFSTFSKIFISALMTLYPTVVLVASLLRTSDLSVLPFLIVIVPFYLILISTALLFLIFGNMQLARKDCELTQRILACIFFYLLSIYWLIRVQIDNSLYITYAPFVVIGTYFFTYLIYIFLRKILSTKRK